MVLFVSALPPHASAQQSNDGKGKPNRIPPGDQRFGRSIAHDRHPTAFATVILELRFLGLLWFDGCPRKCITDTCIKGTGIPDLMLMRRRSQNPYPPNNKQSIQERRSTICEAVPAAFTAPPAAESHQLGLCGFRRQQRLLERCAERSTVTNMTSLGPRVTLCVWLDIIISRNS